MNRNALLFALVFSATLATAQQHPAHLSPYRTGAQANLAPFYHGVASGDPLADRVMIWTRITTDSATAQVKWRIALDTGMVNVVDSGLVTADANADYTVKVDVGGLQPNTYYFYEFESDDKYSLRGRTRTLPIGNVDSLRFAVVSCSNYGHGFFNGYKHLTGRNDFDVVLHLGDYIYEYGDGQFGTARTLQPVNEILSLSDYRERHSYYKLDDDLIRLHQQYPFISVWDDHEVANNGWFGGAANHDAGEGDWFDRKSNGLRAYNEWMPIRRPVPTDTQRIYRKFRFGNLMDLYMLDTRYEARDEQNGIDTSSSRTILGQPQWDWLMDGLDTSRAQWQILGQQVMMSPVLLPQTSFPFTPKPFLDDQWDGYPAERTRLYDSLYSKNINNFVVLTGDIHSAWANDLPMAGYNYTSGAGSAGVEFVTSSITSLNSPVTVPFSVVSTFNRHIKFADLSQHGYIILDVNRTRTQGDWYFVSTITSQTFTTNLGASWCVNDNSKHLVNCGAASVANPDRYGITAPLQPRERVVVSTESYADAMESVLLGVYPNPFTQYLTVQYALHKEADVQIQLSDISGRVLLDKPMGRLSAGVQRDYLTVENVPAGAYVLAIRIGDKWQRRVLVRR